MTTLREKMTHDLQLCGLSERMQEAYLRAARQLADHYRRAPDRLTEQQLRDYFLYLKNEKRFGPASLKMAFYGIRYFNSILRRSAHLGQNRGLSPTHPLRRAGWRTLR